MNIILNHVQVCVWKVTIPYNSLILVLSAISAGLGADLLCTSKTLRLSNLCNLQHHRFLSNIIQTLHSYFTHIRRHTLLPVLDLLWWWIKNTVSVVWRRRWRSRPKIGITVEENGETEIYCYFAVEE